MSKRQKTIGELFEDRKLMDGAVRRAVKKAVSATPTAARKSPQARSARAKRAA